MNFVTIGVYGFTEPAFFTTLQNAGVDTFCDIRWRRGVRGAEYIFANSARLQRRLAELGIRYLHCRDLAPGPALRRGQDQLDRAQGISKRHRTTLGDAFIQGYHHQVLSSFNSRQFIQLLGPDARTVALFCVERDPAACHRSLLAQRLHHDLAVPIRHLTPNHSVP